MSFFEIQAAQISSLNDGDLRELVGRLCEAELRQQDVATNGVTWGGAQEAGDGGVDVKVLTPSSLSSPAFVPRQYSVFQVKKHSMSKAACKAEMLDGGEPRAAITELANRGGAYIIVSGADDCSDRMLSERINGMREAIISLADRERLHLDFYGKDRLASWLRLHPGITLWVRDRLGTPLSGWRPFCRWAATPSAVDDAFITNDHPCVIDMNSGSRASVSILEGINLVRNQLREYGSNVRITGLSGVGKTRFAQALFEETVGDAALNKSQAIYADLGNDLRPTASELASNLIANNIEAYLVLDNCPPDVHRNLQKQVSESGAKLRLLTVEYDISDDRPEETTVIRLDPSSEETVSQLIQLRFSDLSTANADQIAKFSGGNARVAIALASQVSADETLSSFSDEALFKRLFDQRKGVSDDLQMSAEALSLVYSFNTAVDEFNDELSVLATITGIPRATLFRHQSELHRRQLAQQRGNWRAVLPHAVANRLAKLAIENFSAESLNAQLWLPQNIRLLQSYAHRLSFLHDSHQARNVTASWLQANGPLHDLEHRGADLLRVFSHIVPTCPDAALSAIERAAASPSFASRDNPNFALFSQLLRQLAYDATLFDRALAVLLKFAETEKANENHNGIVNEICEFFSPYLSGTHASPEQRQSFVKKLLDSGLSRQVEIATRLLDSAFKTYQWSSFVSTNFGAHVRDYGWQPKDRTEQDAWYAGFIELIKSYLNSSDADVRLCARQNITKNFRGLWSYAGRVEALVEALESIVQAHGKNGNWPEILAAIKETARFDGDKFPAEILARLKQLERYASPSDYDSEVAVYVLATDTLDHQSDFDTTGETERQRIVQKIIGLGVSAANDSERIAKIGAEFWHCPTDSIGYFGEGLAKGSNDPTSTFETLLSAIPELNPEQIHTVLLFGYLSEVHKKSPELARTLLVSTLQLPKLKPHFMYLLASTSIDTWGIKKIIKLALSKEVKPFWFERVGAGPQYESMSDNDFAALLTAVYELEGGVFSAASMLYSRLRFSGRTDPPSDELSAIGRLTLRTLLKMPKGRLHDSHLHKLAVITEKCVPLSTPHSEVGVIVDLIYEGINTYRLYGFRIEGIVLTLLKRFSELFLTLVYRNRECDDAVAHRLFNQRLVGSWSLLNTVPVERLLGWCNGEQRRIQQVAMACSSYSTAETFDDGPQLSPKRVVLSEHIKALLNKAEDKATMLEIIFRDSIPGSYSGSRATAIEIRTDAFAELLHYPNKAVQNLASTRLEQLRRAVIQEREYEFKRNSQTEQRFE